MEEELFKAKAPSAPGANDSEVKALGMTLDCNIKELRILVNGVDITKTIKLQEVRIVREKKEP